MYGKIFERMFTGTMYGSGPVVFSVWAYVIACARPPGVVTLNPKLLAATIGCSTEEIREAIEFLMRPDSESATKDEDGRRLVKMDSGLDYHVVSWQKYRDMRDEEGRREYQRRWVAEKRAELRKSEQSDNGRQEATESDKKRQDATKIDGRQMSTKSTKAEAEAEAVKSRCTETGSTAAPPSASPAQSTASERGSRLTIDSLPQDWRAWALAERPALDPDETFARFRDHWLAQPGARGRKSDWPATWRNWVRNESNRSGTPRPPPEPVYQRPDFLQNIL